MFGFVVMDGVSDKTDTGLIITVELDRYLCLKLLEGVRVPFGLRCSVGKCDVLRFASGFGDTLLFFGVPGNSALTELKDITRIGIEGNL